MKITVLVENIPHIENVEGEHGLSLYIETEAHKILFDMGQSDLLLRNAARLGVDLSQVDLAILSHGHYDHGGGIEAFRSVNASAPLYVSRYAFGAFYSEKYIGLSPKVKEDPHLIETDGVLSLDRGITLYADAAVPFFGEQSKGLTKDVAGVRLPDDFLHEQYLLIEEQGKHILFSGCSHRGILSIARHFAPDVLVGGFHFKNVSDEAFLQNAAEDLLETPALYYTCHCTGFPQYAFMKTKMGDRLRYLSCGQTMIL